MFSGVRALRSRSIGQEVRTHPQAFRKAFHCSQMSQRFIMQACCSQSTTPKLAQQRMLVALLNCSMRVRAFWHHCRARPELLASCRLKAKEIMHWHTQQQQQTKNCAKIAWRRTISIAWPCLSFAPPYLSWAHSCTLFLFYPLLPCMRASHWG